MNAMETVRDAPVDSFLSASGFPFAKEVAGRALRKAAKEGTVTRIRRGLYWKPREGLFGKSLPGEMAVAAYLTRGRAYGAAGASALNALGLSTQVPFRQDIAVTGKAPGSRGLKWVRFVSRANPRREGLTPAEVTLLEGLRAWTARGGGSWEEAARALGAKREEAGWDMGKLLRAAAGEPPRARRLLRYLAAEWDALPEPVGASRE